MMHPTPSSASQQALLNPTLPISSADLLIDDQGLTKSIAQTQKMDECYRQIQGSTNEQTALKTLKEAVHKFKGGMSYLPFDKLNASCETFYKTLEDATGQTVPFCQIPPTFDQQYEEMMTDATDATLLLFLQQWDANYFEKVKEYKLFQPGITKKWSTATKKQFVRYFYHIRGHFHDFLWFLGNQAPNAAAKQKVINNISEEFGGDGKSHEVLFFIFAKAAGVTDLELTEWINQTHYLPIIKGVVPASMCHSF